MKTCRWINQFKMFFRSLLLLLVLAIMSDEVMGDDRPPADPGITPYTVELLSYKGSEYRFLTIPLDTEPPEGFEQPDFDDSEFKTGTAPFGGGCCGLGEKDCPLRQTVQTEWSTETQLLLRRSVFIPDGAASVRIMVSVDNDVVEVFFNGECVPHSSISHGNCPILDEFRVDIPQELVQPGEMNLVAFHLRDRPPDVGQANESFFDTRILAEFSQPEQVLIINDRLSLIETKTKFDPNPVEGGSAGTFTIMATFKNISEDNLALLAFIVTRLTGGNLLLNADDGTGDDGDDDRGAGGAGSILTVPVSGDYSDGILAPGEIFAVDFIIGLATKNKFSFIVDALGTIINIFPPAVDPGAITMGISTTVTTNTKITTSNPSLIPSNVNLVEVNESGMEIAILGGLNDTGTNGDVLPGDKIFGGEFLFNKSSTGIISLAVSASFGGTSGKVKSESSTLEVFPAGVPTEIKPSDMTQAVFDPETEGEIIGNEVTVFFKPGTDITTINQVAAKVNGTVVGLIPGSELNIWQVEIPFNGAQGVHDAVAILEADPATEGGETNGVVEVSGVTPNDDRFRNQYGLTRIEADKAWAITRGSNQVIIGVVDTGVDYNHEDLSGKVLLGKDWFNNDNDPIDDDNHGTHVAGIASALTNNNMTGVSGTSWESQILAVKVLNAKGIGSDLQIARGIEDAVKRGAAIINLSLGNTARSETLAEAINFANKKGRLVVACAGNHNCTKRMYPAGFDDKETFSHLFGLIKHTYNTFILAVGASDRNDNHSIWTAGKPQCTVNSGSNFGPWVDIVAPGTGILSTIRNNNYASFNGTSMATPFVSGVAALVWSVNPSLTARQVHDILISTSDLTENLHPDGRQIRRVNAFNAVFQTAAQKCITCPEPPEVSVNGTTVSMGIAGRGEDGIQNTSVHGITVPLLHSASYQVRFRINLNTWDSYNPLAGPGTGFWDSFSVSSSAQPYYQLSLSDPLDPLVDPLFPDFLWGGSQFGDGVLENKAGMTTVVFPGLGTNFLNIVLDTATLPDANHAFPSWGTIRILDITPRQ